MNKAAQIRGLRSEIEAALDSGHTLKAVCDCLEGDGIIITVQTLGSYVSRMRRKALSAGSPSKLLEKSVAMANDDAPAINGTDRNQNKPQDPLANVRERQRKRSGFDYRPELADPNDLI
ncbi:MAG: hypothetical protein JO033_20200 [Acidobacteriaceae bacterium]|nr:hypothetical protein [Acidobacteriaceae bacterium]